MRRGLRRRDEKVGRRAQDLLARRTDSDVMCAITNCTRLLIGRTTVAGRTKGSTQNQKPLCQPSQKGITRKAGRSERSGPSQRAAKKTGRRLEDRQGPTTGLLTVVTKAPWEYLHGNGALWFVEGGKGELDNLLRGSLHILNCLG